MKKAANEEKEAKEVLKEMRKKMNETGPKAEGNDLASMILAKQKRRSAQQVWIFVIKLLYYTKFQQNFLAYLEKKYCHICKDSE